MRFRLNEQDVGLLIDQTSYRKFIEVLLEIRTREGRPLTFAQLSRQIGVKARSYSRDIIKGSKRITPGILPNFVKALGLTGSLKTYFIDLVEREESDCRFSGRSEVQIERAIRNARGRALTKMTELKVEGAFSIAEIPRVYAALGSAEVGASISEISSRTKLSRQHLKPILIKMIEFGICKQMGNRFFAISTHLNAQNLKMNLAFKEYFLKEIDEVSLEAREQMNSEEKLFFSSAFSVPSKKLSELKTELRDLLLRFVDNSEHSEGDTVVSLVCGFH